MKLTDSDKEASILQDQQGCGNTMPDLVPFHSGQVRNFLEKFLLFQKERQKIDKGTRIYQVNCTVILRKK